MKTIATLCGLSAALVSPCAAAEEPPGWVTEGPYVEQETFSFELPLETLANMLFVEVHIGGAPRRFLFDTGSPSMMSARLADALDLEVVDTRQGRDSHGAIVETEVVQADLTLGGTTLRQVPVFVAEFPKVPQCLFDGVLGSEVLPLCAWQIDLPDSVLRCNSDIDGLDHVQGASRQPLYDSGYPHAPVLDVRFAENATSKALFDTGSPGYLAISPPDLGGARRNGGVAGSIAGHGSLGGSLGGMAPEKDQLRVQLDALAIGDMPLGAVDAVLRESPPSLIGASILEHFVVTLDARSSAAWFDRYRAGPFSRPSYGLGLAFEDGVSVSLIWDDSPAAAAGLEVGQRLVSINDEPATASCEGIRSAMRAMSVGDSIELGWDGGGATLVREGATAD